MSAATTATVSPTHSSKSPRALRTEAFRAAVELCRARLASSRSSRFARFVGVVVASAFFAIALSLRRSDGPDAPVEGLLRKAAGVLAWVVGGILAMAAARDARAADRRDGIEALVAARGVGAPLLSAARTLAATAHIGTRIGIPAATFALSMAALAADVDSALRRVAAALALLAWGAIAGVTLGALASASARFFGRRGPTALVVFVLGQRMIASAAGHGAWSVPGVLEAALSLLLGVTGVGGGA